MEDWDSIFEQSLEGEGWGKRAIWTDEELEDISRLPEYNQMVLQERHPYLSGAILGYKLVWATWKQYPKGSKLKAEIKTIHENARCQQHCCHGESWHSPLL